MAHRTRQGGYPVVRWVRSSRVWMWVWVAVAVGVIVQGTLVVMFWLDSVRAVNTMSVEALVLCVLAGLQTTLTMRKADPDDPF